MVNLSLIETIEIAVDEWNPKAIGRLQGQIVKYTAFQGKVVRPPQTEDELFVVLKGRLVLESNNCFMILNPEEFVLVAKDIEYKALAFNETQVMICTTRPSTEER